MGYEKPEVRDYGSIADHTYVDYMTDEVMSGASIVDEPAGDL